MRNLGLIILLIVITLYGWRIVTRTNLDQKNRETEKRVSPKVEHTSSKKESTVREHTSLFVTYWSLKEKDYLTDEKYESFIYFGVTADKNGIITDDAGYKNLTNFSSDAEGKKTYLTLRMLDTEENLKILEDKKIQENIIQELLNISRENKFDGVVLDLELSAIPFTDVKDQINGFVKDMSEALHQKNLYLGMTMYGDTFYRARPFDVKTLSNNVDEVYVMAYDFHKSRGEPGPNFPFKGKKEYGYDFQQMVSDFTMTTESGKLTIVYGMYGYDWTLGPQGKPLKQATAKTLLQIQEEYVPCTYVQCISHFDKESAATKISYFYEENNHVLWYDNEESVNIKSDYARQKGIAGTDGHMVNIP
jgi:spore germination protein YaaH